MDLKRGIDKAVSKAVESIQSMSEPCADSTAIAQVGTISANSDGEVGDIIAEAMASAMISPTSPSLFAEMVPT